MEKINKRTANYTKEECWRLVEVVERFVQIIENKKTDAIIWKDKKTAWQKVCLQFNSLGNQNRTWEQLRTKYESLKKETRRAVAKCRTDILCTGGGPYEDKPFNPLYEKIRAIIKLSAEGTPAIFDSDYLDAEKTRGTISTCTTTSMLHTPAATNNDCLFEEQNLLAGTDKPSTSVIPLETNGKNNKEDAEPTSKKALSVAELDSETNTAEGNNWTSYCPAQLKKQKHPALQTPKRKRLNDRSLSAAGQKMQPWVDAKTELTNLKLKLIQEDFNVKQEREKELHEQQLHLNRQQIKINDLMIKKLKLEIKNMQN